MPCIARDRRPGSTLVWLLLLVAAAPQLAAAPPPFVLDLPDGGQLPGEFLPVADGDGGRQTLAWRSPAFSQPLEFRLDEVVGVRAASPAGPPGEPRGFSCRLQGGDLVDGELREIDDRRVVMLQAGGEPVGIDRAIVRSLVRKRAGGGAGYIGPAGLAGWKQTPASSWRDEAGRIVSDVRNAVVTRDVGGPPRACYDIVLSWQEKTEFVLAVAAGDGKDPDPYRFEMLAAEAGTPVAMVVRQEADGGMLEPVAVPKEVRGRLRLTLFVDQSAGRLAAAVGGVEEVVDMSVLPARNRRPSSGFRLRLTGGNVCLERLRVSEWRGDEPTTGNPEVTQISLRGREAVEAEEVSLSADGRLLIRTSAGDETPPLTDLEEIVFAAADQEEAEPAGVRVVCRSGGVISGELVAVTESGLRISRPGIDGGVTVPTTDLQSFVSLRSAEARPLPGRVGRIRVADAEVPGCLVDAAAWGGGLAWQPLGGLAGSPLAASAKGAVVDYVPRPGPRDDEPAGQVEVGGIGGAINLDEGGFFVVTMLAEEGAAARDGRIQPGDRIAAIQPGKNAPLVETKGLDLQAVMNLLRGRVGTPVSIRIERGDGGRPRRIDLVRGLIYIADRQVLDEALAAHARVAANQVAAAGEAAGFPSLLVLRSGDIVPADIERLDPEGVWVRSPATASAGREAVVVAPRLVRVVEFNPAAASRGIEKTRWERLLTLPRAQQSDPPGHLLRLANGDYLRGRLESLDAETVTFAVLGQTKRFPRAAVARIIWLHGDEIEGLGPEAGEAAAAEPAAPDRDRPAVAGNGLVVQGVSADGARTTLVAERLEGPVIVGTSPAFGPGRIDTRAIDRLLVGGAVDEGDEDLPFAKWRLRLAPLPRALRDDAD